MSELHDKIRGWLAANGYELGAFGTTGHGCGLETGVLAMPEYTPIDGAHGILVTHNTVQSWTLRYPTNYNDWQPRGQKIPYNNETELKQALDKLTKQPAGMWA